MAVVRKESVIVIDATGSWTSAAEVESIKLVSTGLAGSGSISVDGVTIWEDVVAAGGANAADDVCLKLPQGFTATLSNAKIYLYLE